MNTQINRLLNFALQNQLIHQEDEEYSANLFIDLFKLDQFNREIIDEKLLVCDEILDKMLEYAIQQGWIENNSTEKDLFDTRIMNCVMPRPSEVVAKFKADYSISPLMATKNYYAMSIASNYIRKSRVDKNVSWHSDSRYGSIQISINLSKPEKDPKEIAKAKLLATSQYPKCLLCKENVGFSGDFNKPARQNHRIIPLTLDHQSYYLQYSPYVYYNEHCIVFNEDHIPMEINTNTFKRLLDFVEQFPHYFLGSNADLPIVGGSILSHDHFQGGSFHFPIEEAKVIQTYPSSTYEDVKIELIEWPLSTMRLKGKNKEHLQIVATHILNKWIDYSDESVDIIAHTHTRHNTITPIVRYKNDQFELDLVLRNNRCIEQYPDGIFHPHPHLHHIKKENIGLIEVMGLAILPARLVKELNEVKEYLMHQTTMENPLYLEWVKEIEMKYNGQDIDSFLNQEVGNVFVEVLEDAGVFKMNEKGIEAFIRFALKVI